jgi:hypothetical protein
LYNVKSASFSMNIKLKDMQGVSIYTVIRVWTYRGVSIFAVTSVRCRMYLCPTSAKQTCMVYISLYHQQYSIDVQGVSFFTFVQMF